MGIDSWNFQSTPHNRVRNMFRRGWLLKTYNDQDLLRGRVRMGYHIENDEIDILHPAGIVSHVKASGKHEVFTLDVGGDPSRRVIAWIIGDRKNHPKPDEGETFFYAPDNKKMFFRLKKKSKDGGQGGQSQGSQSSPNNAKTVDSGRIDGGHWDTEDDKYTGTTKSSVSVNGDKGQGYTTKNNFDIKADKNTQFEAGDKAITKSKENHREGTEYVNGQIHAHDHIAGGSTNVQSTQAQAHTLETRAEDPNDTASQRRYGESEWNATPKQGHTSLLQTAAKVGTLGGMSNMMGGMLGMLTQMMNMQNNKNQSNEQQTQIDIAALLEQIREQEEKLKELQEELRKHDERPALEWGTENVATAS